MNTNTDGYADVIAQIERLYGRELSSDERAEAMSALRQSDWERYEESHSRPRVGCMPFFLPPGPLERFRAKLNGKEAPAPRRGVTISDGFGRCSYDILLAEDGAIAYLAIRPYAGQTLASIRRIPEEQLALTAAAYLSDLEAGPEYLTSTYVAHDSDADPSLAFVGGVLRLAERLGPRASARKALAQATGKSLPTVDRLIRAARAADPTLPQATRSPLRIEENL